MAVDKSNRKLEVSIMNSHVGIIAETSLHQEVTQLAEWLTYR